MTNGRCQGRHCSDPRDRIFSVLSIVGLHQEAAGTLRVDYSKTAAQVFEMVWDAEAKHLGARNYADYIECIESNPKSRPGIDLMIRELEFAERLMGVLELEQDEKIQRFVEFWNPAVGL